MKKLSGYFVLSFGFLTVFLFSVAAQNHAMKDVSSLENVSQIEIGQTIEREISGGEKHFYKLKLNAGEFVKIETLQKNCDVILSLHSPEKINIFEFKDDNFRNGLETQTAAVEVSGEYELRIISFEEAEQKGNYALKIAERRTATDREISQTRGFRIVNGLAKNIKTGTATTDEILKVIADFNTALENFRFAGNQKYEAVTLSSIGSFYSRLGNWKSAIEVQQKALDISKITGDKESIAMMLSNLGTTFVRINEPQKALEVLNLSAKISVEREDIYNESRALSLIGNVYEKTGDANRALVYYAQALEKAEKIAENRFVAVSLNDLGKANFVLGENQKALEFFQKAVETARKTNNKRQETMFLGNLGQTFFALGEKVKSLQILDEALKIALELTDTIGEAVIRKKIGQIQLDSGEFEKAFENLNKALEIFNSIEDQQNTAETLLSLAKTDAKKGYLENAQQKAEESIRLIETLRTRVEQSDLRDSFSANLQNFYAFYVEILMRRFEKEKDKTFAALALQVNERARARGLLNLLTESNANIREGVEAKLLHQENDLKNLLSARLENLMKVLSGKTKAEEAEKLKLEIEQIRAEFDQIQAKIRASNPRYAALTQPATLDLKAIQTELLDDNSVLLEYALGEEKSYLWIVSKNDFQTIELPRKAEIENSARQFYEALTARNKQIKFETAAEREDRIFIADSDLQKYSKELGAKIIEPAAQFIKNKRLLIVSDGALQYVPFAALQFSNQENQRPKIKDQFLIETNEIVNLPSASVLAVLRNETANRKLPAKTLAVIADPIFDKMDERFQSIARKNKSKTEFVAVSGNKTRGAENNLIRDGLDLPRLPFTRREAEEISATVPENKREKLLDFSANKAAAMSSDLSNFQYVHFATHGFINNENPELSGIVFSMVNEKGMERDGFLRVGDIYNLKFPAEMVVLSGCRTGLGKEIKGEGLIGLTRGFMYAGAKRVTVSLWDVNDEATAELMARFYKEMFGKEKLSPAKALRRAQISLINGKEWNNPYFWSTFILQGEPR